MELNGYYEHVKQAGSLRTIEHARRWSDAVLKTLGTVLNRSTRRALSQALPDELAQSLSGVFWLLHFPDSQMPAIEFQKRVARRSGNSDFQFARLPTVAVFAGIRQMIPSSLSQQVAERLSPEVRAMWNEG